VQTIHLLFLSPSLLNKLSTTRGYPTLSINDSDFGFYTIHEVLVNQVYGINALMVLIHYIYFFDFIILFFTFVEYFFFFY
jgi:hypothetical protein